jgi:hypothetical protein
MPTASSAFQTAHFESIHPNSNEPSSAQEIWSIGRNADTCPGNNFFASFKKNNFSAEFLLN